MRQLLIACVLLLVLSGPLLICPWPSSLPPGPLPTSVATLPVPLPTAPATGIPRVREPLTPPPTPVVTQLPPATVVPAETPTLEGQP